MSKQKYIGTKLIAAIAMTRLAYNELRNCPLPLDENGDDEGYLVEYLDGGNANVDGYEGYVSWSPKEVFDNAYRPVTGLSFGLAIEALKKGLKVARSGWNGKGMWLELIKGKEVQIHGHGFSPKNEFDHDWKERVPSFAPWIGMKTADNQFVPWLASQTDVLADDWQIID
jgi:hypothetical protein